MSKLIRLSNLFQTVSNSDFPYINEKLSFKNGNRVQTLVLPETVDEVEVYQFGLFLSAIDVDPNTINNYGLASYIDDVFSYHCPCFLGTRDGKLGLLIGSSIDKFDDILATDVFIPCEVNEVERKRGKKSIVEYEYTINGVPINLVEMTDNKGESLGKFYCTVDYVDDFENITFSFPFLIDKKRNFEPNDILRSWRTGQFIDICRDVDVKNSRLWIEANKAFVPSFQSNQFPKDGVFLLVKNGQIKITPGGTYANVPNDIVQSNWEIVATSHPELIINWRNPNKEYELITLGEATDIQFTSAKVKNEGYTWLINNTCNSESIYLIHIVSPSPVKITNSPVNTLTAIRSRIMAKIFKFPDLMNIYTSLTNKELPQLSPSVEPTFEDVADAVLEDF